MLFRQIGVSIVHSSTFPTILDTDAMKFLASLHREFKGRRDGLLAMRRAKQEAYDQGALPGFLPETTSIRSGDWKVSSIPEEIQDRRVEITGPPERKMVINALNSGASVFMADFEDSLSPTWENLLRGQRNLRDAVQRTITYEHPTKGLYKLNDNPAVLFVRPRGLHMDETHFQVGDEFMPASLFDFGLFLYHNAGYLVENKRAPYFYLPKLEHHLEARLWNDIFVFAQDYLSIPHGTIKATVLLETLPAAFQMDEILYELRDHSAGLNCGRWDYIFSYIKTFRNDPSRVLPDRSQVGMTSPFMKAYSERVIQVCHRRGAHAMGGMAAQIPIRDDHVANSIAMGKVSADKLREVTAGHDGTWVAHPGLVALAKGIFDEFMTTPNQLDKETYYETNNEDILIEPIEGTITQDGLFQNVSVGIQYLEAWLRGSGCVPLYNLMEDAATAEISRVQVWQWIKNNSRMTNGKTVDSCTLTRCIDKVIEDAIERLGKESYYASQFPEAASLFGEMCLSETLADFLTLPAYDLLTKGN